MISSTSLPQLKTIPSDFMVSEVHFLNANMKLKDRYSIYKLTKCGYTTFNAIAQVMNYFALGSDTIGYGGLKDEDGITEQFISIDRKLSQEEIDLFNGTNHHNNTNFITLQFSAYSHQPIQVGEILGNQFKIIIRGLDLSLIKRLQQTKKYSFEFLNYYGAQRFGLPGSTKNTHVIGERIIHDDYYGALHELTAQANDVGEMARVALAEGECAKSFFTKLDQRQVAFYQSAYYSSLWNEELKNRIMDLSIPYNTYTEDGLTYFFICGSDNIVTLPSFLTYHRIVSNCDGFKKLKLLRQVKVQLNIVCHQAMKDKFQPTKWALPISFFLPSGSYATMAVNQLLCKYIVPELEELVNV